MKNIALLRGKPLIAYTIDAALSSNLNRVIVSTDCDKIAKVARDCNAEVMMRPVELARDNTPTIPVLQHVIESIEEDFDFIVTLQPTSPFRTELHINEALRLFENDTTADTLVSVTEVPHNMVPSSLMSLQNECLKRYQDVGEIILRRQDKPILFARNGPAILIMNTTQLQKGELYGGRTLPYIMNSVSSIDIDDKNDLLIAEQLFNFWRDNN